MKKKEKIDISDIEKERLIKEIIKVDPDCGKYDINLRQYTKEQLQLHLEKVKGRKK